MGTVTVPGWYGYAEATLTASDAVRAAFQFFKFVHFSFLGSEL